MTHSLLKNKLYLSLNLKVRVQKYAPSLLSIFVFCKYMVLIADYYYFINSLQYKILYDF